MVVSVREENERNLRGRDMETVKGENEWMGEWLRGVNPLGNRYNFLNSKLISLTRAVTRLREFNVVTNFKI
jgi:hypothetical protein